MDARAADADRAASDLRACSAQLRALLQEEARPAASRHTLLLTLLGRLTELPISCSSLRETGLGVLVNSSFFRRHARPEVRVISQAIVADWKARLGLRSPAPAASRTPCNDNTPGQAARTAGGDSARVPSDAELAQWPVVRLRARIKELGLSSAGCVEKSDLISLLRGASLLQDSAAKSRRRSLRPLRRTSLPATPRGPAGRPSSGRRSLLRRRRSVKDPAPVRLLSQKNELKRILRAGGALDVLGIQGNVQSITPRDRGHLIRRRYRELSRLVHPDKCPPELRDLATRAFQRLEDAKKHGMIFPTGSATASTVPCKRRATEPQHASWGGR